MSLRASRRMALRLAVRASPSWTRANDWTRSRISALDGRSAGLTGPRHRRLAALRDRKSTRLNSSHANISYAVFCLKKKTQHSRCLPLFSLPPIISFALILLSHRVSHLASLLTTHPPPASSPHPPPTLLLSHFCIPV